MSIIKHRLFKHRVRVAQFTLVCLFLCLFCQEGSQGIWLRLVICRTTGIPQDTSQLSQVSVHH